MPKQKLTMGPDQVVKRKALRHGKIKIEEDHPKALLRLLNRYDLGVSSVVATFLTE